MKKLLTLLTTILLLFGIITSSYAGFEDGFIAYTKGDYETSFNELKPLADVGNDRAQLYLAHIYSKGKGVPEYVRGSDRWVTPKSRFREEAVKWYRKAADQGNVKAQISLANMYYIGDDVLKDYKKAAKWFRKAAEQGYVSAQYNLGVLYENGDGVLKDYKEAAKWYHKAADQGDAEAQFGLAFMYGAGEGVLKDPKQALKWYHKAADQGYAKAQFNLAFKYRDVLKNIEQAIKWYRKAADQGYVPAQYHLGVMYAEGNDVLQDLSKAKYWFNKTHENPDVSDSKTEDVKWYWNEYKLWNIQLKNDSLKKEELAKERRKAAEKKVENKRALTQEIQAETDQERKIKANYINSIAEKVKHNWRYRGAEDNWGCDVYILQDLNGKVESVNIQSCFVSNKAKRKSFRDSIERAVYKASPLPKAQLDGVFHREILMPFRVNF